MPPDPRKSLEALAATLGRRKLPPTGGAPTGMKRILRARELVVLGIGAIVGTGVFVMSGVVIAKAGPGAILSLLLSGLAATLMALLYAELAAMLPVSGGAYTYTYVTFGEVAGWLVGWSLVLYYTLVPAAVAVGWSGYVFQLLGRGGPGRVNVVACLLVLGLMGLIVRGLRQSVRITAWLVALKLAVLAMFVALGLSRCTASNWHPFTPYGWPPLVSGGAILFFAHMGFDVLCTAADECEAPQRDLPVGIIGALMACMGIYALVAAALIGAIPAGMYPTLLVQAAPLAFVLRFLGYPNAAVLLSFGAAAGMLTVAVVLLTGQARLLRALGNDGLLMGRLSKLHPTFRTPHVATVVGGTASAIAAAFLPLEILIELANLGVLVTFLVMAAAAVCLRRQHPEWPRPFRVPLLFALVPAAVVLVLALLLGLPRAVWGLYAAWLALGGVIYATYGYCHSRLAEVPSDEPR